MTPIDPNTLSTLARARWNEAGKTILKASQTSTEVKVVRRINEVLFVRSFLPFFCGEEKPENFKEMQTIWIEVAGDMFSEVDIVDAKGDVVATVPPMGNRDAIKLMQDSTVTRLAITANRASEKSSIAVQVGDNILMQGLHEIINTADNMKTSQSNIRQKWEVLLARYGKSFDKQTKASSKTGMLHNVTDDDFQ